MHNHFACPVLELMPEFARTVERRYALDDARCAATGLEFKKIKRDEDRNNERLGDLECLIMTAIAGSELGRTLQIILAQADVDTLYSWTLDEGEEEYFAARSRRRLDGMLESLLHGRDISRIPSAIREAYLGSSYGDTWTPDGGVESPVPGPMLPGRGVVAAS
ncbi:MAG: hypothetical protein QM773_13755 [Hyphomonadaceae bacterium]